MTTQYLVAITVSLASFLLRDIAGWRIARSKWAEGGHVGPPPAFDWALFWATAAKGVLTGILTAAGASLAAEP